MNQNRFTQKKNKGRFQSLSLRNRLLLAFILLAILPVLITGSIATVISRQGLEDSVYNELESVAVLKQNAIKDWLNVVQNNLSLAFQDRLIRQSVSALLEQETTMTLSQEQLRLELVKFNSYTNYYTEIFVMNRNGETVLSTNSIQEGKIQLNQNFFQEGMKGKFASPPIYEVSFSSYSILISEPILNTAGTTIGVLAARVNLATLDNIMQQDTGLGEAGETYLISSNYAVLTNLDHSQVIPGETYIRTEGVTDVVQNKNLNLGAYVDYSNTAVFGAYSWIPELQIVLVAEYHQADALQASNRVLQTTVGLIVLIALLAILVSFIVTNSITSPITKLVNIADNISHGNLDLQAEVVQQDEIGVLAQSFNIMTSHLRDLIGSLEQRVSDRTKALATSTEVSRKLSTILDEKQLVNEVVNQVQSAFNYYHVHIYLMDDKQEKLIMASGTGEVGKTLLSQGHAISVGKGLVGRTGDTNTPILVADTSRSADWLPNPLLPDTKAEIAVPISLGSQVLGVLDVQQNIVDGLKREDVDLLQSIANQAAVALQNARTLSDVQQRATREQMISSINQKIQSETTVESAMQVAVREIGRVLGTKAIVKLNSNSSDK